MAKRDIKAKRWERRRRRKVWNALLRAHRRNAFVAGRIWGKATMQEIWLREFCCVIQNPDINRRVTMALDAITGKAGVGK